MKIDNVRVYGLEESIIASGYPLKTTIPTYEKFSNLANDLCKIIHLDYNENDNNTARELERIKRLANTPMGSGHNCALKGAIVQYDLTAPEYFWRQFDRYHFHDYISSQSKMHCILKFDISKMCNKYVDQKIIEILNDYISTYNNIKDDDLPKERLDEVFQQIISNCPMGIELTARITDNYLQLKSKYKQRRHHKLEEWHYYCNWIETLPMSKLITGNLEGE
jgi:hypothetical protein